MTAAPGSAFAAGLAVRDWKSVDEISDIWWVDRGSDREMVAEKVDVMYAWWGEGSNSRSSGDD